jgi:short-chain fatty acids transporter
MLSEAGSRLSDWFERWFPDAFVFAALGVAVVFAASVAIGNGPVQTADWFGSGFWDLGKFTMQMAMIIVSGYAVAASPPVHRGIERLASLPKNGRSAAAWVAVFSMATSLLSWSFSLIFSGLLAREVLRRVEGSDERAVGAAAYMGLGSVWALGLSSSAALLMASPASMPPSLLRSSGTIPLTQTILLWQSLLIAAVLMAVSAAIAYGSAPEPSKARRPAKTPAAPARSGRASRPGERLDESRVVNLFLAALGAVFLVRRPPLELLDLNNYIFLFLVAALALHPNPRSFLSSVSASVPATAGVLIQFPLYAGVLKIMTESGLASRLAHLFVAVSTRGTFPLLVGTYSAALGLLVPSAGGKWLLEAPYLLEAARTLHAHPGWVVQTYNAAEALPNLIHPFWMLPLLGLLGLKARDLAGYCSLQLLFHAPIVLTLVWALHFTLP